MMETCGWLSKLWSLFWIPIIIRHLVFRVITQKGIVILTATHVEVSVGWGKRPDANLLGRTCCFAPNAHKPDKPLSPSPETFRGVVLYVPWLG